MHMSKASCMQVWSTFSCKSLHRRYRSDCGLLLGCGIEVKGPWKRQWFLLTKYYIIIYDNNVSSLFSYKKSIVHCEHLRHGERRAREKHTNFFCHFWADVQHFNLKPISVGLHFQFFSNMILENFAIRQIFLELHTKCEMLPMWNLPHLNILYSRYYT